MPDSKNIQQLSFNFGSPEEGCCGGDCHSEPEDTQGVQAEPAPEDTDAELQEDGDQ